MVVFSILIALVAGGVGAENILHGESAVVKTQAHLTKKEARVVLLINRYRVSHHLKALTVSVGLSDAALEHSRDMVANEYFDHRGFPLRVRRHRTDATLVGENIAWGSGTYGTPAGVMNLWKGSPPHNKILLTKAFKRVGVGMVEGEFLGRDDAVVTTANFSN